MWPKMIFIDKIWIEDHNKHRIDHIEIVFYCFIDFVEWKKPRTQPIACFIGLAAGNSFWTGIIRVNCVCVLFVRVLQRRQHVGVMCNWMQVDDGQTAMNMLKIGVRAKMCMVLCWCTQKAEEILQVFIGLRFSIKYNNKILGVSFISYPRFAVR